MAGWCTYEEEAVAGYRFFSRSTATGEMSIITTLSNDCRKELGSTCAPLFDSTIGSARYPLIEAARVSTPLFDSTIGPARYQLIEPARVSTPLFGSIIGSARYQLIGSARASTPLFDSTIGSAQYQLIGPASSVCRRTASSVSRYHQCGQRFQ